MENQKEVFMRRASEVGQKNVDESLGGPFGAVIVKNGEIIAEGANHVTTWNDPSAHAEVVAIREACKKLGSFQLDGCELYSSCEPCPMCLGAIYWARPNKVYYSSTAEDAKNIGLDDAFIYEEIEKEHEQRKIPFERLIVPESQKVFETWAKKTDKTEY